VPPAAREVERSALVNEEVVYLIFQLELDGALQRALNLDAFEAAQQVRARREQVDLALKEVARRKARAAAAAAVSSAPGSAEASEEEEAAVAAAAAAAELTEADVATEGLRLRTEMARAASEERYAEAARFRDLLSDLERRAKQAAAALEAVSGGEAGADGGGGGGASDGDPDAAPRAAPRPPLRLGQRVVHRALGYRGVVVGWDASCCEDDDWAEGAGAPRAPGGGLRQRYYHVLVDARDWPPDPSQPPVAYVADALLSAPERDEPGRTWSEVYGGEGGGGGGGGVAAFGMGGGGGGGGMGGGGGDDEEAGAFRHPYAYVLFLGQDAAGDLLACRQLRDRYNQQRRDVWRPGAKRDEEEEDDDRGEGGLGGGGGGGGSGRGGDSGGGGDGRGPTSLPGIDMSSLM